MARLLHFKFEINLKMEGHIMKTQLQFRKLLNKVQDLLSVQGIGLFLILGLSLLSYAADARGSELRLSAWDDRDFEIEFDHQHFFADRNFKINDLNSGQFRLKVYRQGGNPYGGGGGHLQVLFDGYINIDHNSRIKAAITRNRTVRIIDVQRLSRGRSYTACSSSGYGNQNNGHNNGFNNGNNNGGYGTLGYGYDNQCLSQGEFNRILRAIDNACFDSDMLNVAKQATRNQHMTSDQVRIIVKKFSFESSRLNYAKFGFSRVVDPNNYYLVNESFCFSSSIRELDDWLCQFQ
ncbi:MAG: hypothetical protein ACI84C_001577 [Flavobacteriales bacterium]